MKIAVCTLPGAPDDMSTWSGTPANFLTGLAGIHPDVAAIGPLAPATYTALNALSGVTGRLGRKLNWEVEADAARFFTRRMDSMLERVQPDVAVVMGWMPFESRTTVPLIFWGDATVGQRVGRSPHWSGLSRRTTEKVHRFEGEALRSFESVMMASRWAADDAVGRYGLRAVSLVPFGSNMPDPRAGARPFPTTCRLLAVGVKWERKGMDRAVHTADELWARGIDVHLDVVGIDPPDSSWERSYVTYHGFLDKDSADDLARLDHLYRASDLFLFPTRNEPFGIVLAEAASYALPVIASAVDGVPDRVEHGTTGLLLDRHASPADYADAVETVMRPGAYEAFSSAAREKYERDFTWDGCARVVLAECERVVARAQPLARLDPAKPSTPGVIHANGTRVHAAA